MNIAYVHSGEFPSKSPSQTFVIYNAIGLTKSFSKVYLFLKKNGNKTVNDIFNENFDLAKPSNLIIETYSSLFHKSTNHLIYKKYFNRLSELCENKELDAIITRRNTFLPFLCQLKSIYKIPVFFETHDFYADLTQREDIDRHKKRREERLERKYIPKLSGVFCLQNSQKKLYKNIFPNTSFHLLRTGLKLRKHHQKKEKKYIIYVGSFDNLKGIETLLNAIQYIQKDLENINILLIGGKSKRDIDAVEKIIKSTNNSTRVSITGWIPKNELNGYLEESLLGILPLKNTFFNRNATSPLKLFDYYSYSIPVVASDLPSCRELILEGKTGLFFEPENPEDLAGKIKYLLDDKKKLEYMQNFIGEYSKNLTWEKRGEAVFNIITQLKLTDLS